MMILLILIVILLIVLIIKSKRNKNVIILPFKTFYSFYSIAPNKYRLKSNCADYPEGGFLIKFKGIDQTSYRFFYKGVKDKEKQKLYNNKVESYLNHVKTDIDNCKYMANQEIEEAKKLYDYEKN